MDLFSHFPSCNQSTCFSYHKSTDVWMKFLLQFILDHLVWNSALVEDNVQELVASECLIYLANTSSGAGCTYYCSLGQTSHITLYLEVMRFHFIDSCSVLYCVIILVIWVSITFKVMKHIQYLADTDGVHHN